jgi:hypothetical protein
MPDREDLSFRENCNIKKKEKLIEIWLVNSAPLRSTPIHDFGTVSAHRAVLFSDQGQSSQTGYCYLFTNQRA